MTVHVSNPINNCIVILPFDCFIDFVDGGMMSSLKRSGNNYGTLNSSESHTSFQRGTRTSRVSIIIQYKYSGTPYKGHA